MTDTKPDLLKIFTDMKRERREEMEEAEVNFDDADILEVALAALTAAGMVIVPRADLLFTDSTTPSDIDKFMADLHEKPRKP